MHVPFYFFATSDLLYVWDKATPEGKAIIFTLAVFSIFAWSVMASKAMQMRRAKKLNGLFESEFRTQKHVLDVYDRRVQVPDCPLFMVYQEGCRELDTRLKNPAKEARKRFVSLKAMEHVKRTLERTVAQQSLKLESGLILLAPGRRAAGWEARAHRLRNPLCKLARMVPCWCHCKLLI